MSARFRGNYGEVRLKYSNKPRSP